MTILSSTLYQGQLQTILDSLASEDIDATKKFKLYLDTIILNMPSKAKKYKPSIYFEDENIRDIEHQGFTIIFLMQEASQTYTILGIVKKELV